MLCHAPQLYFRPFLIKNAVAAEIIVSAGPLPFFSPSPIQSLQKIPNFIKLEHSLFLHLVKVLSHSAQVSLFFSVGTNNVTFLQCIHLNSVMCYSSNNLLGLTVYSMLVLLI